MAAFSFSLSDQLIQNDGFNSTDPAEAYYAGDTITFLDLVSVALDLDPEERIFLLDSIKLSLVTTPSIPTSDLLNFTDLMRNTVTYSQSIPDTLVFTDSLVVLAALGILLADSETLSDAAVAPSVSVFQNQIEALSDTLKISDSLSYTGPFQVLLGDRIIHSDTAVVVSESNPNSYLRRYLNDTI